MDLNTGQDLQRLRLDQPPSRRRARCSASPAKTSRTRSSLTTPGRRCSTSTSSSPDSSSKAILFPNGAFRKQGTRRSFLSVSGGNAVYSESLRRLVL
ncbi:hypothetical protein FF1_016607 [Malus domestica]